MQICISYQPLTKQLLPLFCYSILVRFFATIRKLHLINQNKVTSVSNEAFFNLEEGLVWYYEWFLVQNYYILLQIKSKTSIWKQIKKEHLAVL